MPLVEVIATESTAPEVSAGPSRSTERPATARPRQRRRAGFIGNRLQHALWREAISLVEHGLCDAGTVDTVVEASFVGGWRCLAARNADLVGTDVTLAIHNVVLPAIDRRPDRPLSREDSSLTKGSVSDPARLPQLEPRSTSRVRGSSTQRLGSMQGL